MEIETGFDNFSTLDESDMLLYGNMLNHIQSEKKPFLREKPCSLIPEFYNQEFEDVIKKPQQIKRQFKYFSTKTKNKKTKECLKKIKTLKIKTRNSSLKNMTNDKYTNTFKKKKIKNSIKVKKTQKLNHKSTNNKLEIWDYIEKMEKTNLSLFIKDLSKCKIKSL